MFPSSISEVYQSTTNQELVASRFYDGQSFHRYPDSSCYNLFSDPASNLAACSSATHDNEFEQGQYFHNRNVYSKPDKPEDSQLYSLEVTSDTGTNKCLESSFSTKSTHNGNSKQVHLWQFLIELLTNVENRSSITWTDKRNNEFKLLEPEKVASLWGLRKRRPHMNYDKLSRSLRYYYEKRILEKVPKKRYTYRFLTNPNQLQPKMNNQEISTGHTPATFSAEFLASTVSNKHLCSPPWPLSTTGLSSHKDISFQKTMEGFSGNFMGHYVQSHSNYSSTIFDNNMHTHTAGIMQRPVAYTTHYPYLYNSDNRPNRLINQSDATNSCNQYYIADQNGFSYN